MTPAGVSHVFRLGHRYIWRSAFVASAILVAFFGVLQISSGRRQSVYLVEALELLAVAGCAGLLVAGILYYLRWRLAVEITQDGIDGCDVKGDNCFIRWGQMHDCARFTAYLFVPCILIRHSAAMWAPLQLPLGLERRDEFVMLIQRYAGSDCELGRALES